MPVQGLLYITWSESIRKTVSSDIDADGINQREDPVCGVRQQAFDRCGLIDLFMVDCHREKILCGGCGNKPLTAAGLIDLFVVDCHREKILCV